LLVANRHRPRSRVTKIPLACHKGVFNRGSYQRKASNIPISVMRRRIRCRLSILYIRSKLHLLYAKRTRRAYATLKYYCLEHMGQLASGNAMICRPALLWAISLCLFSAIVAAQGISRMFSSLGDSHVQRLTKEMNSYRQDLQCTSQYRSDPQGQCQLSSGFQSN